jgi:hypothetical protein
MDTNFALEILEESSYFVDAEPLVDVPGMSSARVCHFLNRLVDRLPPDECYFEAGTWKGRTLISAALRNFGKTCVACDDFRFWGRFTGPGVLARRALYRNLERYRADTAEIRFHPVKYREAFANRVIPLPIGVYFYDANHSYGGTYHGIVGGSPFLAERSVLLVDDWNDPVIRQATRDGIDQACLRVLWHAALPGDMSELGWWNGVGAFYLEKERAALRMPVRK